MCVMRVWCTCVVYFGEARQGWGVGVEGCVGMGWDFAFVMEDGAGRGGRRSDYAYR
jgi:hypothetical protein